MCTRENFHGAHPRKERGFDVANLAGAHLAGDGYLVPLQQLNAAPGSARHVQGVPAPHGQHAYVERVEPIHVFLNGNGLQHTLLVDVLGQGQLHEDAVHRGVLVVLAHHLQHLLFCERGAARAVEACAAPVPVAPRPGALAATRPAPVAVSGRFVPKDTMPHSSQPFFLLLTYACESLRSPTSTTASPGLCGAPSACG